MGIGKEIALQFASKHKCNIVVYDIRADLASSLLEEIKKAGGKGYFYECDVSNQEMVKKIFADTYKHFPVIDILINNAGIILSRKIEDFPIEEIQRVMNVNFMGPLLLTKQVLPVMKHQKFGHIVTIASIAAHVYSPDTSIYASSKAALFTMFSALRMELKRENSPIKTTIVCPWSIDTGMFEGFKVPFTFFGLIDFLKTKSVARSVYKGIMKEKDEVYLPFYQQILFRVILMLPTWLSDPLNLWLSKDAMKGFIGRDKKVE